MKNKAFQEVEKFILSKAPVMIEFLGLDHFQIDIIFSETFFEDDAVGQYKTSATTIGRWQYRQAKIIFYLPSVVRHDAEELEKILLHEFCHVLLLPEQSLVDSRLILDNAEVGMTSEEHSQLEARNYELLELSTENVTIGLWKGWQCYKESLDKVGR